MKNGKKYNADIEHCNKNEVKKNGSFECYEKLNIVRTIFATRTINGIFQMTLR